MSKNPKNVMNETSFESLLAIKRNACGIKSRAFINKLRIKLISMIWCIGDMEIP